jgi:hypothetical protein
LLDHFKQGSVQVNPVDLVIRMSMSLGMVFAQLDLMQQLARVKASELERSGFDGLGFEAVFQTQVVEHFDRVGTHLHRSADFTHMTGLFVDAHAVPITQQTSRGCQAADSEERAFSCWKNL